MHPQYVDLDLDWLAGMLERLRGESVDCILLRQRLY